LVEAIIEDQLPLTCTDVNAVDFATILKNNSRFRISFEMFSELYALLLQEIERRMTAKESVFIKKLERHLPTMEPESYSLPAHRIKMLFNPDIRHHLLSDPWRVGVKLLESERLKREAERGTEPLTVLESFDELATAVQRFEVLSRLWDHIRLLASFMTDAEVQENYGRARIYRFGESVEVMGNAVNATVMFLDLRGFTEASEGLVSERDLTRQLYTVFDPFIEIISRFGGQGPQLSFRTVGRSSHGHPASREDPRAQGAREDAFHDGGEYPSWTCLSRTLRWQLRRAGHDRHRAKRECGGPALVSIEAGKGGGRG
jgi:hypothetical protein